MKILRKKNITNEAVEDTKLVPPEVDLEPVVDHTTANTLASKLANEEKADKNIKESEIEKVADEVVKSIQDPKKDTPAPKTPSLKPYTEAKQVADRRELSKLIKECKEAGRKYKIKRSLEEGFRYIFEEYEDAYPECYFVCNSENEDNETGYFDTLEDAKAYAEAHPEICCIFKICGNEEEKVWVKPGLEECNKKDVHEDVEEDNPAIVEDEVPETFEGKMDYLAKDEQEAIDGYNKVLALLGDDEANVKEQLNKILEEEIAHREFLEKVKEDHSLVYEHEHEEEPELEVQEKDVEIVEESVEEKHVCPKCGKEVCECDKSELEETLDGSWVGEFRVINRDHDKGYLVFKEDRSYYVIDRSTDAPVTFNNYAEYQDFLNNHPELKGKVLVAVYAPFKDKFMGKDIPDDDEKTLDEAIIEPVSEPEDEDVVVDEVETDVVDEPEITPELDPEAEIEIDSIETFEPTDEIGKKTMTTIKDAGEGAMWAFKDTLKDLFNLKIKVSDLQQLLSSSSDWLLDLLGFNGELEQEIHSEEIPEVPVEIEEPEIVGGEFDDVEPVTDLSAIDINDFDDVEPIEYEEEDEKFFVED